MRNLSDVIAGDPSLDLELDLDDGDVIVDLCLVARIQRPETSVEAMLLGVTQRTSVFVQSGLLDVAACRIRTYASMDDD